MDDLKKKGSQDRSKINMHEPYEVKYWTKELGVDKEQLQGIAGQQNASPSVMYPKNDAEVVRLAGCVAGSYDFRGR